MRKRNAKWDLFISHASEDKKDIVDPLAQELARRGLRVWYDRFALKPGDSLRGCIELGLAQSRFGIVVLSKAFFAKKKVWPERELSALYVKEDQSHQKVVIPIWHKISARDISRHAPTLANLVALKTDLPLLTLVKSIIKTLHQEGAIDIKDRLSTGIPALDVALRGGLPRPSSILIVGPKGIGKTTLSIQIQGAALSRGESGLYITYRESPTDILKRFNSLGFSMDKPIQRGKFRILDNFSALHGISEVDIKRPLDPLYRKAIVYITRPQHVAEYFERQFKVMEELGFGGVNVIDSVNERLRLLGENITASRYFKLFRAKLARVGGQSALHILSIDSLAHKKVNTLLHDFQDGSIVLRFASKDDHSKRYLAIDSLRDTAQDPEAMEFYISNRGVTFVI